jgi:WD40 repeat protein
MILGSMDRTVRIWEISTARCFKTWTFDGPIHAVSWNPNPWRPYIAVATYKIIFWEHEWIFLMFSSYCSDKILMIMKWTQDGIIEEEPLQFEPNQDSIIPWKKSNDSKGDIWAQIETERVNYIIYIHNDADIYIYYRQ